MSKNYLEDSVGKTLFLKSLPMFLAIFANIAYNLADTFFVAKLGTPELAAMSFGFPVVMIILNLMMGIATGVNSLTSRSIGEGDHARAKDISKRGLQFTFVVSVLISIIGLFTLEPLFTLLGADEDLMGHVKDYMIIWYLGSIFMNMTTLGTSLFRARGNVLYPSVVLILGACINAALDPILIFGFGPIPAMGIQGAAITTVFGNVLSAYLIFSKLRKEEDISLSSIFKIPDLPTVKKIARIALPTALANSFPPLSTAVTNWMLVGYGATVVAANSIAIRLETVPFIAIFALCSVFSSFIGQNWGAQNIGRIREGIKKSFLFSYILGAFCTLLLLVYKESIVGLFDSSPEVLSTTSLYFSLVPFTYGILGTVFLTINAMNAVGKPFAGNFLSALRLLIIYLPFAFYLNIQYQLQGIFVARVAANLFVGLLATALVYRTFFKSDLNYSKTVD